MDVICFQLLILTRTTCRVTLCITTTSIDNIPILSNFRSKIFSNFKSGYYNPFILFKLINGDKTLDKNPLLEEAQWGRRGVRVESLKTLKTVEERSPRMVCVVWGAGKSACHTSSRCGVWCGVFVSSDQKGISFPPHHHHTHDI